MPLNSADLKPQNISKLQLNREEGVKLIEMIEYAFCVMMISEMNSIMFYGVNILLLVENYIYGILINKDISLSINRSYTMYIGIEVQMFA